MRELPGAAEKWKNPIMLNNSFKLPPRGAVEFRRCTF